MTSAAVSSRRRIEDLDGGFVAPGFVASHIHLSATGLTLSGLDLRPARSRAECLHMVAGLCRSAPRPPGMGSRLGRVAWPENAAPKHRRPGRGVGDRPAYLARVDVHSALASTGLRPVGPELAELAAAAGFTAQQPLAGARAPPGPGRCRDG